MSGLSRYNNVSPTLEGYLSDPERANTMTLEMVKRALGDLSEINDSGMRLVGAAVEDTVPTVSIPLDEKGQPVYPGDFALAYRNTVIKSESSSPQMSLVLRYDPKGNPLPKELADKLRSQGFTKGMRTKNGVKEPLYFLRLQKMNHEKNLDPNVIFTDSGFTQAELDNPTPLIAEKLSDATAYLESFGLSSDIIKSQDPSLRRASIIRAVINQVAANMGMMIIERPLRECISYDSTYVNEAQFNSIAESQHRGLPVFTAPKHLNSDSEEKHFVSFVIHPEYGDNAAYMEQIPPMVEHGMTMQLNEFNELVKTFEFDCTKNMHQVDILYDANTKTVITQLYGDWVNNPAQMSTFIKRQSEKLGIPEAHLVHRKAPALHIYAGDGNKEMSNRSFQSMLPRFLANMRGLVYSHVNIRLLRSPDVLHPEANYIWGRLGANNLVGVEVGIGDENYKNLVRDRLAEAYSLINDDMPLNQARVAIAERLNKKARPEHFVFTGHDIPFLKAALGSLLDPSANLNLANPINAHVNQEEFMRKVRLGQISPPRPISDYTIQTSTFRYITPPMVSVALGVDGILSKLGGKLEDYIMNKIDRELPGFIGRNSKTSEGIIRSVVNEGLFAGQAKRVGGMCLTSPSYHPSETLDGLPIPALQFTFRTFQAVDGGGVQSVTGNSAQVVVDYVSSLGLDDPEIVFINRHRASASGQSETPAIKTIAVAESDAYDTIDQSELDEINSLSIAELKSKILDHSAFPLGSAIREAVSSRIQAIEDAERERVVKEVAKTWKSSSADIGKSAYANKKGMRPDNAVSFRFNQSDKLLYGIMVTPAINDKGEAVYKVSAAQTISDKGKKLYVGPTSGAMHHISGPRPHDKSVESLIVGEGAATTAFVVDVAKSINAADEKTSFIAASNANNIPKVLESIVGLRHAQNAPIKNIVIAADNDMKYPEQRGRSFTGLNHANNPGMLSSLMSAASLLESYPKTVGAISVTKPTAPLDRIVEMYLDNASNKPILPEGIPTDFADFPLESAVNDYSANMQSFTDPYSAYKEALKYCGVGDVFTINGEVAYKVDENGAVKVIEPSFNSNGIAGIMQSMVRISVAELEAKQGYEVSPEKLGEIFRKVLDDCHEVHGVKAFRIDPVMTSVAGYNHRIEGFDNTGAQVKHASQAEALGSRLLNSVTRRSIEEQSSIRPEVSLIQSQIDGKNVGVIFSLHSKEKAKELEGTIKELLGNDSSKLAFDPEASVYTFPVDDAEVLARIGSKLSPIAHTSPLNAAPVVSENPERSFDLLVTGTVSGVMSQGINAKSKKMETLTLADFISKRQQQYQMYDFNLDSDGQVSFKIPPSRLPQLVGEMRNNFSSLGASSKGITYRPRMNDLEVSHADYPDRESELIINGDLGQDGGKYLGNFFADKLRSLDLMDDKQIISERKVSIRIPFSKWDSFRLSLIERFPDYDIERLIDKADDFDLEQGNPRIVAHSPITPEGRIVSTLKPIDMIDNRVFSKIPFVDGDRINQLSGVLEDRLNRRTASEQEKESRRQAREAGLTGEAVDSVVSDQAQVSPRKSKSASNHLVLVRQSTKGLYRPSSKNFGDSAFSSITAEQSVLEAAAMSPLLQRVRSGERDDTVQASVIMATHEALSADEVNKIAYVLSPSSLSVALKIASHIKGGPSQQTVQKAGEMASIASLGEVDELDMHDLSRKSYRELSEGLSKKEREGLKLTKAAVQFFVATAKDSSAASKNFIGLPENIKDSLRTAWAELAAAQAINSTPGNPVDNRDQLLSEAMKVFAATALSLGKPYNKSVLEDVPQVVLDGLAPTSMASVSSEVARIQLERTLLNLPAQDENGVATTAAEIRRTLDGELAALSEYGGLDASHIAEAIVNYAVSPQCLDNGLSAGVNTHAMAALRAVLESKLASHSEANKIRSAAWGRLAAISDSIADGDHESKRSLTKAYAALSAATNSLPSGTAAASIYSNTISDLLPESLQEHFYSEWMAELSSFRPDKLLGVISQSIGVDKARLTLKANMDIKAPFSVIDLDTGLEVRSGTLHEIVDIDTSYIAPTIKSEQQGNISVVGLPEDIPEAVAAYRNGKIEMLPASQSGPVVILDKGDNAIQVPLTAMKVNSGSSNSPLSLSAAVEALESMRTPAVIRAGVAKVLYESGITDILSLKSALNSLPSDVEAFVHKGDVVYHRNGEELSVRGLDMASQIQVSGINPSLNQRSAVMTKEGKVFEAFVSSAYVDEKGDRVIEYVDPVSGEDMIAENAVAMDIRDADMDLVNQKLNENFAEHMNAMDIASIGTKISDEMNASSLAEATAGLLIKSHADKIARKHADLTKGMEDICSVDYRLVDGTAKLYIKGTREPVFSGNIEKVHEFISAHNKKDMVMLGDSFNSIPRVVEITDSTPVAFGVEGENYGSEDFVGEEFANIKDIIRNGEYQSMTTPSLSRIAPLTVPMVEGGEKSAATILGCFSQDGSKVYLASRQGKPDQSGIAQSSYMFVHVDPEEGNATTYLIPGEHDIVTPDFGDEAKAILSLHEDALEKSQEQTIQHKRNSISAPSMS